LTLSVQGHVAEQHASVHKQEVAKLFDNTAREMYQNIARDAFKLMGKTMDPQEKQSLATLDAFSDSCSTATGGSRESRGSTTSSRSAASWAKHTEQDNSSLQDKVLPVCFEDHEALDDDGLETVYRLRWYIELQALPFPFAVMDPSQETCPLVALSQSLASLLGCTEDEAIGRSWREIISESARGQHRGHVPDYSEDARWCDYFQVVNQSAYGAWLPGKLDRSEQSAALAPILDNHVDGEHLSLWNLVDRRSGDGAGVASEMAVLLKQVEMDDCMFLLGFLAKVPAGAADRKAERYRAAYHMLSHHINIAQGVLAKDFWLDATLRRDTYLHGGNPAQVCERAKHT